MDEKRLKDESPFSKVENNKVEKTKGKPKGLPKSGGRTKGTPNKANVTWSEILNDNSFSVPEKAIEMFNDISTPANIKFQILQFLAQYTSAAIKPKENEQPEPVVETQSPTDILKLVNQPNDK